MATTSATIVGSTAADEATTQVDAEKPSATAATDGTTTAATAIVSHRRSKPLRGSASTNQHPRSRALGLLQERRVLAGWSAMQVLQQGDGSSGGGSSFPSSGGGESSGVATCWLGEAATATEKCSSGLFPMHLGRGTWIEEAVCVCLC